MEKILNFIGGEFCLPRQKLFMPNVNPAYGEVYSELANSDESDVNDAVRAAKSAFSSWSKTSPDERAHYLRKMAHKISEQLDQLAKAESRDSGKPIRLAKSLDIPRSQKNFEFFADTLAQLHGETYMTDRHALNYTTYSPLGVVACISPWNLPLYLFTWKIAPALAAGNTVVAKPSELTPMTASLLARIAVDVGLPPGVLNIVNGTGPAVGRPLVDHPDVKAVSFTGSTATGRSIAVSSAAHFKKNSLEMGGKNANIIFADCDFNTAVATTVRSSFLNQGQICLCGSRILVEKSIYEKFKSALVEETKKLRIGDPADETTDQGALVSEGHLQKVVSYLEKAKKESGHILCGGERTKLTGKLAGGYFVAPTLIENLSPEHSLNQEEIFGPVATLIPFENEAQALQIANGTKYGLSASLWTQDLDRANRVANELAAGVVWINTWMLRDLRTPFGGVKESGVGREGGVDALKFFSEVKNICLGLKT